MTRSKMARNRKIGGDFLLNLLAALILLFTTEFVVLPQLATRMSTDEYGQVLMLLGIITAVSSAFGNGLNNVRLILHHKYEVRGLCGDYNVILCFFGALTLVLGIIAGSLCGMSLAKTFVMLILSLLGGVRLYLSVAFRIRINYMGILLLNGILSLGYVIGLMVYLSADDREMWWMLFLFAEIISLGYLLCSTELFKEPLSRTPLFKEACKCFGWLGYLTLLGSLLNVMERNIILPVLGGEAVSILFVAMLTGKTVSYVAKPMGNVMLSYFAQTGFVMTRKKYWKIILATVITGVVCYLLSIGLSGWVIHHFYPGYKEIAMQMVIPATAIPILMMVGALAQPAVLRFAKLSILSFLQSLYVAVYIIVAVLLTKQYGVYGFCYAAIILALLRIFILWWLGLKSINSRRKEYAIHI